MFICHSIIYKLRIIVFLLQGRVFQLLSIIELYCWSYKIDSYGNYDDFDSDKECETDKISISIKITVTWSEVFYARRTMQQCIF